MRRDIRASAEHLIVGIDTAKDKHHAFFGTAKGKTIFKRLIFTNDLYGAKRFINGFPPESYEDIPDDDFTIQGLRKLGTK